MRHLLASATLVLAVTAPGAHAQVQISTSLWTPVHHTMTRAIRAWCDDIAEQTQRRVVCNILPKAVSSPAGSFDAVRDGVADMAFSVHGYTPGRFVLTEIAELPFTGDSAEVTSVAYQRIHERYLAEHDEHRGLKVMAVFTHGPGNLYNTRQAVRSLEDLQRLKWRVGGGMINDIGKALGANVTLKPAPESFSLLSTGIVDGVVFPTGSVVAFKLDDLIKHRTTFPGGLYNTSFALVMNPAVWDRIPKTDQDVVTRLSGEHLARHLGRAWDEADRRAAGKLKEDGVVFTVASPAFAAEVRKRIDHLEQNWADKAAGRGLKQAAQVVEAFREEVRRVGQ